MSDARLSACMLFPHKGHTDTTQAYSVTAMTHVKALQADYAEWLETLGSFLEK